MNIYMNISTDKNTNDGTTININMYRIMDINTYVNTT